MLKRMKARWKRAFSGLLAVIMAAGMLPASALAADTGGNSNPYAPTGSFELNVAGATAWNDGNEALTVYKTEGGSTQATTIPAAVPFALLEDKGGDRLKVGYQNGGWTGANLDGTGWVDKDSVLVNLPDILPSITYDRDSGKLFNSRLTRFEYIVPGSYALAEQLAQLQQEAMSGGETLVVRQSGQTVSVSRAKGDPAQLHSYSLNGVTYQKYDIWTEYEAANGSLSDLSYDLPYVIDRAYSADPSVTLTMFCPQTVKRAPSKVSASDPTGGVGAYNPGSPGGKKPTTSNVDWSVDHERTFLRFTLIEFPQGVVTDLNTRDWGTWHVVGTPLNVIWSNGWSVDQCRRDITWYNSSAMQYNGEGTNAAQLMGGSFESGGVYSYDATGGSNSRWVTTADEFQKATGISDQQKEKMFHCNSSSWSTGWTDNDYTSMWGTDAEFVTPGNLYKVYKANDAFLYLLNCLSTTDAGSGWSKDEAMERWSEYVHDADGNLRNQVLPGAEFRVTTAAGCEVGLDGVIGTATLTQNGLFTTDSNGEIRISNLAPGAYVLTETKAPAGYVMDSPSTNVVIGPNGDTQTVIITNTPKATLTITKRDAVTRKPLANAEFIVRDSEGHAVGPTNGIYKTGTDGTVVVSGLEPGSTIMVSESKAPTGYILDETPKSIVVKSGISNSLIFDNEPGTTLIIRKFVEGTENEPLSGVCFKVVDGSGAAVGPDDGCYYTDKAGEIVLEGIEPGTTVKVREIKTVEGFVLDGT